MVISSGSSASRARFTAVIVPLNPPPMTTTRAGRASPRAAGWSGILYRSHTEPAFVTGFARLCEKSGSGRPSAARAYRPHLRSSKQFITECADTMGPVSMIRIRDAADLLGVSDDTVRRWIDDGTLPADQDAAGRKVIP